MIKRRSYRMSEPNKSSSLSGNMGMDKAKRGGRNSNPPLQMKMSKTMTQMPMPKKKKKY